MKKIIFFLAGLANLSIAANAQKLTTAQVPATVKASFVKAHPDVKTVKWEKEKNDYEAEFEINGKETSENYTAAGALVEVETAVQLSELPAGVTTYVAAHHKGAKIKEASKIIKADGSVTYEAAVGGKDLIFDDKGNFVK